MRIGDKKMLNRTNHQNFQKMSSQNRYFLCLILMIFSFTSCKKNEGLQEDPYAGGKESLGIRFSDVSPKPISGAAGSDVVYQVTGLMPYKDKIKFYLNETEAMVTEVTDKTIKIKVPENASTGGVTIVIDEQIFFGPEFVVNGKLSYDNTFKITTGTNRAVNQIMPLPNGNFIFVGGFSDFNKSASAKQPINNIVSATADGTYLPGFSSGFGAGGPLTTIAKLPNGQFLIGGSFSSYNKRRSIGGLTRLNSNGSLDTTVVEVVNLTPLVPKNSYDTVAAFNGVAAGAVKKIFVHDNKIITVGSFTNYGEYFYERSTRDNKVIGYTKMNMLMRMKEDGKLDSTYNFNLATGTSYEAGNGEINDAIMLEDGKVILAGSFTRFQEKAVNRIVRMDNNGLVDPSFNVGSGADGPVNSIRYNAATNKFMVSGAFKNFNGKPANGAVMLNRDGSVDESFKVGELGGGSIGFSAQLSNGYIIATGSFTKYNGVVRQGFMILNPNGTLAAGYNNTGMFQGVVSDIYETTSSLGVPAVIMVGNISKFNNLSVGNIVKFTMRP